VEVVWSPGVEDARGTSCYPARGHANRQGGSEGGAAQGTGPREPV